MVWLFCVLGCIDKAPTDASLLRRTLTLRVRNHSFFVSRYFREQSYTYTSDAMMDSIMEPVLRWTADGFEPDDYPSTLDCRNASALVIRKYTLFSHWDEWGVEEDQYGEPISQAQLDEFFQLASEEKVPDSSTQEQVGAQQNESEESGEE